LTSVLVRRIDDRLCLGHGQRGDGTAEVPSPRRRVSRAGRGDRSPTSADLTDQQGRALAVHAFLHGAPCGDRRVSALLGVSARTVGRDRARPPLTGRPPILERAQTLVAASADRGSTPEERAAAVAWLTGEASPVAVASTDTTRPTESIVETTMMMEVSMLLERPVAPLTRDQAEACCRLHRRIRVRTDVIRGLLEPDPTRDEMMEVVYAGRCVSWFAEEGKPLGVFRCWEGWATTTSNGQSRQTGRWLALVRHRTGSLPPKWTRAFANWDDARG
jgi:hypothetical protein